VLTFINAINSILRDASMATNIENVFSNTVEPPYNDFPMDREKNLHREGINLWKIYFQKKISG
jgi:hypothetical protein